MSTVSVPSPIYKAAHFPRQFINKTMGSVWCPETAYKAYLDAVESLADRNWEEASAAELLASMAGGWKVQLVVEAWAPGSTTAEATSIALAAAMRHVSGGRHICVVSDDKAGVECEEAMRNAGVDRVEVAVGDAAKEVLESGVDFLVVDCRRDDAEEIMREVKPGPRGMIVVCKNMSVARPKGGKGMTAAVGMRVEKSAFLPVGKGMEILHVGVGKGQRKGGCRRWIKHVDRDTGEQHMFRR